MNRSTIAETLERIISFLDEDGAVLLGSDTRRTLLEQTSALLEKARQPGEILYVGILGGTGVGKSTLINALAGSEISSPGDRRPFTDRAVLYRHEETHSGLEELSHRLRDPDALHEIDFIRDLVLIDLPDFDSVEPENRQTVLDLLPRLDCVVWVVSPEKYADDVFYRFVRETVIAKDNFTFVLNKADQLEDPHGKDPHSRFKDVLGDLTFRLRHEAGLEQPRIFCFSAAKVLAGDAPDGILQDEFQRFRNFLMVKRDAKEIASLKTVNLNEGLNRLLADIRAEVKPEEKRHFVRSVSEMEEAAPVAGAEADLRLQEMESGLAVSVSRLLVIEDSSIGPVRLAMRLLGRGIFTREQDAADRPASEFTRLAAGFAENARSQIEKISSRMDSELLLAMGSAPVDRSGTANAIDAAVTRASTGFSEALAVVRESLQDRFSTLRRLWQKAVLAAPALVLTLKLVGIHRIERLIDSPSLGLILKSIAAFFTGLFGSDGLIGLCVLFLFEVFLVWYLASGRVTRLERKAKWLARYATRLLETSLEKAVERLWDSRRAAVRKIAVGVEHLNELERAVAKSSGERARDRAAADDVQEPMAVAGDSEDETLRALREQRIGE